MSYFPMTYALKFVKLTNGKKHRKKVRSEKCQTFIHTKTYSIYDNQQYTNQNGQNW